MEKVLIRKIVIIISLLVIFVFISCKKEQNKINYYKKMYDILIKEGKIGENFIYQYTAEVFPEPRGEIDVSNFELKVTNIKDKSSTNYLIPTIMTPVFELRDMDNDGKKDIFMTYYTGGMHVHTYEQLVFSSRYGRLFTYNAERIGTNEFGKPRINYSPRRYPGIHKFFKTNIKNIVPQYGEKFKRELNPDKYKKIK